MKTKKAKSTKKNTVASQEPKRLKPNGQPMGTFVISIDDGYVEYSFALEVDNAGDSCIGNVWDTIKDSFNAPDSVPMLRVNRLVEQAPAPVDTGIFCVINVGREFTPQIAREKNPTALHTSLDSAHEEAERLASLNPDQKFAVFKCETYSVACMPIPEVRSITMDDVSAANGQDF